MYLYETVKAPYQQYYISGNQLLYWRRLIEESGGDIRWDFWEFMENGPTLKKWPETLKINGRRVKLIRKDYPHPGRDPHSGLHKLMRINRTCLKIGLYSSD